MVDLPEEIQLPTGRRFGTWLYKKRLDLGVTQVDLARRAGISNVTISYIETGRTENPSEGVRSALIRSLNDLANQRSIEANQPDQNFANPTEAETAAAEDSKELNIPGIGSLEGFDPYSIETVPNGPGVYVFTTLVIVQYTSGDREMCDVEFGHIKIDFGLSRQS